eukprot:GILJ01010971.1.p1 GENE.GILJ01010971.1~~GILJ01010971.1.p1  ORF type:complete len:1361 (-),score=273.14 GILJ01010971.1:111-4133(-)
MATSKPELNHSDIALEMDSFDNEDATHQRSSSYLATAAQGAKATVTMSQPVSNIASSVAQEKIVDVYMDTVQRKSKSAIKKTFKALKFIGKTAFHAGQTVTYGVVDVAKAGVGIVGAGVNLVGQGVKEGVHAVADGFTHLAFLPFKDGGRDTAAALRLKSIVDSDEVRDALPATEELTFELASRCMHWPFANRERDLLPSEKQAVFDLLDNAFLSSANGWPSAACSDRDSVMSAYEALRQRVEAVVDNTHSLYKLTAFMLPFEFDVYKEVEINHIEYLIDTIEHSIDRRAPIGKVQRVVCQCLRANKPSKAVAALRNRIRRIKHLKPRKGWVPPPNRTRIAFHENYSLLVKKVLEFLNPEIRFDGRDVTVSQQLLVSPAAWWLFDQFASWFGVTQIYALGMIGQIASAALEPTGTVTAVMDTVMKRLKEAGAAKAFMEDEYAVPGGSEPGSRNHRKTQPQVESIRGGIWQQMDGSEPIILREYPLTKIEREVVQSLCNETYQKCEAFISHYREIYPSGLPMVSAENFLTLLSLYRTTVTILQHPMPTQHLIQLLTESTDRQYKDLKENIWFEKKQEEIDKSQQVKDKDNKSKTAAAAATTVAQPLVLPEKFHDMPIPLATLLDVIEVVYDDLVDTHEIYRECVLTVFPEVDLLAISANRYMQLLREDVQRSLDPFVQQDLRGMKMIPSVTKVHSKLKSLHSQLCGWLRSTPSLTPSFSAFPPLFIPFVGGWVYDVRDNTLPKSMAQILSQETWTPMVDPVRHSSSTRDMMMLFNVILDVYQTLPQCQYHLDMLAAVFCETVENYVNTQQKWVEEKLKTKEQKQRNSLFSSAAAVTPSQPVDFLSISKSACVRLANLEYLLRGSRVVHDESAVDLKVFEQRLTFLSQKMMVSEEAHIHQNIVTLLYGVGNESTDKKNKSSVDSSNGSRIGSRSSVRAEGLPPVPPPETGFAALIHNMFSSKTPSKPSSRSNSRPTSTPGSPKSSPRVVASINQPLPMSESFRNLNSYLFTVLKRLSKELTQVNQKAVTQTVDWLLKAKQLPQTVDETADKLDLMLFSQLNEQLRVLSHGLYEIGFQHALKGLFHMIRNALVATLAPEDPSKGLRMEQVQVLEMGLTSLDDFFDGDGQGLRNCFTEGRQTQIIRDLIHWSQVPTSELVEKYYQLASVDSADHDELSANHVLHLLASKAKMFKDEIARNFLKDQRRGSLAPSSPVITATKSATVQRDSIPIISFADFIAEANANAKADINMNANVTKNNSNSNINTNTSKKLTGSVNPVAAKSNNQVTSEPITMTLRVNRDSELRTSFNSDSTHLSSSSSIDTAKSSSVAVSPVPPTKKKLLF